jgi:phage-related protein
VTVRVAYYEGRGSRPVDEYTAGLRRTGQDAAYAAYLKAVEALELLGPALRMPESRLIDRRARVFELRIGAHRVAYAFVGESAVLLHAWRKRSQRLDRRELATALRRLAEVEA